MKDPDRVADALDRLERTEVAELVEVDRPDRIIGVAHPVRSSHQKIRADRIPARLQKLMQITYSLWMYNMQAVCNLAVTMLGVATIQDLNLKPS